MTEEELEDHEYEKIEVGESEVDGWNKYLNLERKECGWD